MSSKYFADSVESIGGVRALLLRIQEMGLLCHLGWRMSIENWSGPLHMSVLTQFPRGSGGLVGVPPRRIHNPEFSLINAGRGIQVDGSDVKWDNVTFTADTAIISVDETDPLVVASCHFGGDMSVTKGTFTIVWNHSGIFNAPVEALQQAEI